MTQIKTDMGTLPPTVTPPEPSLPNDPVMMSELHVGGSILLILSVIFTFVNGFLIWLAFFKNWTAITRSKFFNSFFLGLVLSVTDLVLAVFVGFPASLHLTWMSYFRMQPSMPFYSMYVGHFLFVFIFNFRVLIVALMSLDSFFHIMFPFLYEAGYESRRKVHIACIIVAAIPIILKIAPGFIYLMEYNGKLSCMQYEDLNATTYDKIKNPQKYYVPLNCYISLDKERNETNEIVAADVVITTTIATVSWFILAVTNVAVLFIAVRRMIKSPFQGQNGKSMKQIVRSAVMTCLMVIFTFMLSNFPHVVTWLMNYLSNRGYNYFKSAYLTDRVEFYLTLLSFLSLIFNPWFFVLRLKSFRELLKKFFFKIKVLESVNLSQNRTRTSIVYPTSNGIDLEKRNSKVSPMNQRERTITNIAQETRIVSSET